MQELETRLASWLDIDESNLVVTSNATVALMVAIFLSPAHFWHVPAWSFPATALAPLNVGKEITFVDIRPEDWLVADNRESDSIGLMNVIPFGGSFDSTAWAYPGELVIDAAASLAARPLGLKTFPESVSVVFSLHATKTMGAAEGGVVVFGSKERAKQARAWINFGFSGQRESTIVGTNGKMSEYDAAVANARLDGWAEELEDWLDVREIVTDANLKMGMESTPKSMGAVGPYWIVLFPSADHRRRAMIHLSEKKIDTRLWWGEGLSKMPAFRDVRSLKIPTVEGLSSRYLGLPFFIGLSEEQADWIAQGIKMSLN